jgi:hypothetical protein
VDKYRFIDYVDHGLPDTELFFPPQNFLKLVFHDGITSVFVLSPFFLLLYRRLGVFLLTLFLVSVASIGGFLYADQAGDVLIIYFPFALESM